MAIQYLRIKGQIKNGRLQSIDLPENVGDGEVEIVLTIAEKPRPENGNEWKSQPWTEAELEEFLKPNPLTMGELLESGLIGGWKDRGIADSLEFIERLRLEDEKQSDL
jgi:hypothetical protein